MKKNDPLKPAAGVLIKLGSLAVHTSEYLSPFGHRFDRAAIQTLLDDKELIEWLAEMDKLAYLPKKRS